MILRLSLINLILLLTFLVQGQDSMTMAEKEDVIEKVSDLLRKKYVLQSEGLKMSETISTNFRKGDYESITDKLVFSEKLTSDLRGVFPDKHLGLIYKPWAQQMRDSANAVSAQSLNRIITSEILSNDIGYLHITSFTFKLPEWDEAIAKLVNSKALIIDLRNNLGGSGHQGNYALSHFLPGGLHFSTIFNRKGRPSKSFTRKRIPGKRMLDIPLVILIDENTFSAAEGFAYQLQSLDRATVIGKQSAGGAHPKKNYDVNSSFYLSLSISRSENVITKTDWEGTGVIPDIEAKSEVAMEEGLATIERLLNNTNSGRE